MTEPNRIFMSGIDCVDGVQTRWSLSYPFVQTDAGRASSRRPKQTRDCTVRALAGTTGMSYDDAYDALKARGRKSGQGTFFPRRRADDELGRWRFLWESYPAVKGRKRMNVATFCEAHPTGTYVVRTARHVFAVVDGVVHDQYPERPDRCVYGAWRVVPAGG